MNIVKTTVDRLSTVDFSHLNFGEILADHMFMLDYEDGTWTAPSIVPYDSIPVLPAMSTLHYGQAVFEGMKAFQTPKGINVFRPQSHFDRLNRSSTRLCIPQVDTRILMDGLVELLKLDRNWVPKQKGQALYIRPFIFATDSYLGIRVSGSYKLFIITSPVGSYYKEGINPVSLITSGEYVRAVKGGLGCAKTPANYAASLLPSHLAKEQGYTQVLWLDGIENRYIEEVGTMNIFFRIKDQLITPALEGSILDGITRDSIIHIAKAWGIPVAERKISIDEVFAAADSGDLQEVFGTGTAAVISPVGKIRHKDREIVVNNNQTGELATRFYNEITSIQYGEKPGPDGWCLLV